MSYLAERVRDLTMVVPDDVWQETQDLASDVATLEARLQLVKELALVARNAAPYEQEPYWVSHILQAIGESE